MAHDRWQRDKFGFTYINAWGKYGHVGFGFRTRKSRPQVEVASAAEMRRLFVLKGPEATRLMNEILGALMGEWIPDAMLRCNNCCTIWSQDEYDARDGICCCGGEIRSQR